ncbi:MAG: SusC/RagA family TonB-linked outer membrane protein, partial [Muribaculaceae bacterium]|nr:SusC/RagA family TonB-linked outer membrane protein [Muribaculaceae bacterium]
MKKHLFATLALLAGAPMCGYFAAYAAEAPQTQSQAAVTVTGSVLDESNQPVIGASVTPQGSTRGVTTNFDGNFTIKVAPGTMLNISYIGYKTATVPAAQGMTVYLQPTTEMLNEVVAVGYGSQKRANLTGAVATVDVARAMDSRPVTDVAKALQGAVPGLTITTANGDISGNPKINIRGTGTLANSATSSPLIVVDGVPVDDLSYLNPEDIEAVSVLKDASSSSIYGSRAAFGVILVTTKMANREDRVSVKYNNNFGWGTATILPEYNTTVDNLLLAMDNTNPGRDEEIFGMYYDELLPFARAWQQQHGGKQYTSLVELHKFQNWNSVGDYYTPDASNRTMPAGLEGWDYSKPFKSNEWLSYADWDVAKTLFGAAFSQKHNVSLEGHSGKTNYRVSFGYNENEGLWNYNPDKIKRYMANASVETQVFSFLKAGARFNFSQRDYTAPHESGRSAYQYVWRFPSQFENYGYIYDENGEKMGFRNEITYRMNGYNGKTTNTQTRMQAFMVADILPGLTVNADFTYTLRDMNSDGARVPFTMYSQWTSGKAEPAQWTNYAQSGTYAAQSSSHDQMWTANVFATYQKSFNKNNLKVMVGWNAEQETYRYYYAQRNGLVDYNLPNLNLTNSDTYSVSASHTHRATTGFFGRINYDYNGIYLLELNGRYDGSSRFPANDQWAFFPSASAGYRFSEEKYFAPIKATEIITNGKIRASYGHIGNEAIGSNMFLSTAGQVSAANVHWLANGQKITEYSMPSLVSSSLTWERIITTDVGLDLGFLNNSLNLSFDWFQRDTHDMMGLSGQQPAIMGANAPIANSGALRTNGWELSLNWNH